MKGNEISKVSKFPFQACIGDISSVVASLAEGQNGTAHIDLTVDSGSTYIASMWEINLSSSNDSNKIAGSMGPEAKTRLRSTQDVPEYNTQLSMVMFCGGWKKGQ